MIDGQTHKPALSRHCFQASSVARGAYVGESGCYARWLMYGLCVAVPGLLACCGKSVVARTDGALRPGWHDVQFHSQNSFSLRSTASIGLRAQGRITSCASISAGSSGASMLLAQLVLGCFRIRSTRQLETKLSKACQRRIDCLDTKTQWGAGP